MCGICGFANHKDDRLLRTMTARLIHRGPDEDGYFLGGERVSLGMRRLKVIDLATGSQPMYSEDGRVSVVFNGEIYNFRGLRAELEAKGHSFRSNSDTEVLVHLYEEHGAEMAGRLRGMFAFAVWDARDASLLLARDQFGVKPLFYAFEGGKLFFASEIKALPLGSLIRDELDPAAIDAYFTRLYIPSPMTVYKHVKKLEPAQTLHFKDGKITINGYWRPPETRTGPALTEAGCLEAIDGLLGASVKEQLAADVPLGLLLSGGLDSSAALYYMTRASSAPVKTFTVGYGPLDSSFDEAANARLLSKTFGTEHHELSLDPDITGFMQKLAAQFDEPFADASAIPTYLVTAEARKDVTVALTGIGGDEMFGGYPRYLGARLLPYYLRLPGFMREGAWTAARHIPESLSASNTPGRIKRFLEGGRGDFRSAYKGWMSFLSQPERARIYSPGFSAALSAPDYALPGRLEGPEDIFAFELRNYLSDDLLCLADRTSMANSLELRVPFLDLRLAEFMAGVPLALKTRNFKLKYLVKKLMKGRLPEAILGGRKRGFQVPLGRWYKEELHDLAHATLGTAALRKSSCLSPEYMERMLETHESGRRNMSDQIHAAMMFELWLAGRPRPEGSGFNPGIGARQGALTVVTATDIIPYDDEGGSGRVAWESALRLAARGHKVIVITKGVPNRRETETVDGIEVWRYGGNPFRFRAAVKSVTGRYGRPDALYLHHPYTGLLALQFFRGVPAVYNFHSPWGEEYDIRGADMEFGLLRKLIGSAGRKFVERRVLRASRTVFSASRFMAGKLSAAHGQQSRMVPLGVDTGQFRPAQDIPAVRRKLNIPPGRFVIFTVRNLVSRMGLENLVEAAAEVVKKEPGVLFIIGGRGYLREKLERLIETKGLSAHVRLEGYIPESDLPLYYQAADLFVLPTRLLEGFGLVTLEALACGTPVLATPVAANREVLGAFSESFLLRGDAPADIAEGICNFMVSYGGRSSELRAQCRAYIELNYSWEKYTDEVEKALREAADGK